MIKTTAYRYKVNTRNFVNKAKITPPCANNNSNTNNISNYYYLPKISFKGQQYQNFDKENVSKLPIGNLHFTNTNGVRGEGLYSKKNRKYITELKKYGIKQIIDIKTIDSSPEYKKYAENKGLKYLHFPVDSKVTDEREIIQRLKEFFETIDKGCYYIGCAQGLHRTDIALSLNYLFNVNTNPEPPVLYGHIKSTGVRIDDIFRRTNSIYKHLSPADKEELGLQSFDEAAYKNRKRILQQYNEKQLPVNSNKKQKKEDV